MPEAQTAYTADSIKTLSALEHIRLRPGMYIGRMGDGSHPDDGIYILLKEIIDNSIDEFIMGCGRRNRIFGRTRRMTSISNLQKITRFRGFFKRNFRIRRMVICFAAAVALY